MESASRPLRLVSVLAAAVALAAVAAVVWAVLAGRAGDGERELVLSLAGVSGVVPGDSVDDLRDAWDAELQYVEFGNHPPDGVALLCFGDVRGLAYFVTGELIHLSFVGGVTTPEGVRVGASVDRLRQVYGSRLIRRYGDYVLAGPRGAGRRAMWFETGMSARRVEMIAFARIDELFVRAPVARRLDCRNG